MLSFFKILTPFNCTWLEIQNVRHYINMNIGSNLFIENIENIENIEYNCKNWLKDDIHENYKFRRLGLGMQYQLYHLGFPWNLSWILLVSVRRVIHQQTDVFILYSTLSLTFLLFYSAQRHLTKVSQSRLWFKITRTFVGQKFTVIEESWDWFH